MIFLLIFMFILFGSIVSISSYVIYHKLSFEDYFEYLITDNSLLRHYLNVCTIIVTSITAVVFFIVFTAIIIALAVSLFDGLSTLAHLPYG